MKPLILATCFLMGCLFMVNVKSQPNQASSAGSLQAASNESSSAVLTEPYGKTKTGEQVTLFTMKNKNGLVLKMIDYGATVVSLETPDRQGKLGNIVLTCPNITGFEDCTMYFNGTVGRFCNRIAKGQFSIGDKSFQLATNNGPNHLHGGVKGYDKVMWKAEASDSDAGPAVTFKYLSKDGEENYPGNLEIQVTYTLSHADEFIVEFRATTDSATHVNLTNHNYWNLAGKGTIQDHELRLASAKYLPVDDTGIPTGDLAAVANTPFDFNQSTVIGSRFDQLTGTPIGYDHCYVVDGTIGTLRLAAVVKDKSSGRSMEIHTTEPGIQFYTGNFLDGTLASGNYPQYSALCLETQHFPDSPNQPKFPTTLLNPGEKYFHKTVHKFKAE